MAITLGDADKIIAAARASASTMGSSSASVSWMREAIQWRSSAWTAARFYTADVARGKAMVSAIFGRPSAAFAERAGSPVMQRINQMHQGSLVFGQGAVPVTRGDEVLGAVGFSGGSSQQDEDVASAGIAAL